MTIEERLENMERELGCVKRRNHWLLAAILVLLGGLVAAGVFKTMITPVQAQMAGTAKEIRAGAFILEDENGKSRARLDVGKDGPGLVLYDEKGQRRVGLDLTKHGPGLLLYDEKRQYRAGLILVSKYGPGLEMLDENGKTRFVAGMTATETPDGKTQDYPESSLLLFGPDGKVIWSAIK